MSRQRLHLLLPALASLLLTGADRGGCGARDADCDLECEFGFKTDDAGNEFCECRQSDGCILLYPAPHRDPNGVTCHQFGTVCDIPAGWVPCHGCTYDGAHFAAGESFTASDGCNTCTCGDDSSVACTEMACVPGGCSYEGAHYEDGETFPAADGCNTCTCLGDDIACTEMACLPDGCSYEGAQYEDGDVFPAVDGCNTCTCIDGLAACTEIACATCEGLGYADCSASPHCEYLAPGCGAGADAIEAGCYALDRIDCLTDDDCGFGSTCQTVIVDPCYEQDCRACGMERQVCRPAPECWGAWLDQNGVCRTPSDGVYPDECCADPCWGAWLDQNGTCRTPSDGVYPDECCADPCWGAWVDQTGTCRAPNDGVYPPECCPPSDPDQGLCEGSGGAWDLGSCGHYTCGAFPDCDAVIPGCDCGAGRNFVDGVGCVYDAACGGSCAAETDCPAGSSCNTCPIDPTCPICAVCGPPVCEPIVCDFDSDCPPGSQCVGSSVCPPDVTCVWEGEPGRCEPL